jgi:hypothetical protein
VSARFDGHFRLPGFRRLFFTTDPSEIRGSRALQQMGCGQTGAAILGGMLSIAASPFKGSWIKMEEAIGKTQIQMGIPS